MELIEDGLSGDEGLRSALCERFRATRGWTEQLAAPLSDEDQLLQSMPSASPTKWHRAHTTWFFETFLLGPRGVEPVDPSWGPLFNSYYVAVGPRHARPKRGLLSRPSASEVTRYRSLVDERVLALIARAEATELHTIAATLELGLAHEQQHQELLLTDILSAFAENPLQPTYRPSDLAAVSGEIRAALFTAFEGGLVAIGTEPSSRFRFDNEEPRHRVFLEPFAIADRLVTVGEWRAFADAGGYDTPSLWQYTKYDEGVVRTFGLRGVREPSDAEPIAHLSYYEADAIARFLEARLPTEAEWEIAAPALAPDATRGNFVDELVLHPLPAGGSAQVWGDVWEWTSSAYGPYPGYRAPAGAVGEYNGKFMINQLVLRGGSAFTPRGHVRPGYRNFWHPDTRFQLTGLRLARSAA